MPRPPTGWLPILICLAAATTLSAGDVGQALALFNERRYAESEPLFRELAHSQPNDASVAYHLGILAIRRGDSDLAVESLERAITLEPGNARYQNAAGDAYGIAALRAGMLSKLGLARRCLAAYERAVALEPDNVAFRMSLMSFHVQAPSIVGGGTSRAREQAEEIAKRDPYRGAIARASLLMREKRWEEAFATIDECERQHPGRPELLFHRGLLASESSLRLDQGAAALEAYIAHATEDIFPPVAAAYFRLGMVYEKLSKRDAARTAYERARELDPSSPKVQSALDRLR